MRALSCGKKIERGADYACDRIRIMLSDIFRIAEKDKGDRVEREYFRAVYMCVCVCVSVYQLFRRVNIASQETPLLGIVKSINT